jgi:UDP-glucose 4-epimerase/UDP-glucuronate decarboxylase
MTSRRILVTGGAGFIGYHLSQKLAANREDQIAIVDNFVRGARDDELTELLSLPNVTLVNGDVCEPDLWRRIGGDFDEVYHLAAIIGVKNVLERPYDVVRVNALSTVRLLDWFAAGGGEKLLFSSTSEAYAWTQQFYSLPIPTPEESPLSLTDLTDPRSAYAGSKIFGELAVTQGCRVSGKRFSIVRYHNVYGPRMGYDHVIPELFARATGGENPLTVYSADHQRAFCYVSDAVEATIAAMRVADADGMTINIGNDGEEVTIAELASRLLHVAGIETALAPKSALNDPIRRRSPDLSRARSVLEYEPRVGLEDGLRLTLDWYARRPRDANGRNPRAHSPGRAERSTS